MRKTLLIAGAALAASIISSQAQTVYSQNIVGYVNQAVPGGFYQIVSSQLINGSDSNQTNGDINACLINGFISSPVPATIANPSQLPSKSSNSVLYVWNTVAQGYNLYYYFNQADATTWETTASPAGWYTDGGAYATGVYLTPGLSAFVYNNSGTPMTITTVGTVGQGTNVSTIATGYNLIALQVPVSTNLVVDASGNPLPFGLPTSLTSSNCLTLPSEAPTLASNDQLLFWNESLQGYNIYYFFNQTDATAWEATPSPAGFYTAGGAPMTDTPTVNQGFFLHHIGAPVTWTNTFIVQ